eukprot:4474697-Prorocentrum_lima.AAC.1
MAANIGAITKVITKWEKVVEKDIMQRDLEYVTEQLQADPQLLTRVCRMMRNGAVSYTHLTLPTICSV